MAKYDCSKCPGYCCSYPVILVTKRDVKRMAKHFDMTEAQVEKKYLRDAHGYKRIMKRKKDKIFPRICQFFDTEKRHCTIYKARPEGCREFPGKGACGYYEFLKFERDAQEDPDYISTTHHIED
jgi:uncharacterized protein